MAYVKLLLFLLGGLKLISNLILTYLVLYFNLSFKDDT